MNFPRNRTVCPILAIASFGLLGYPQLSHACAVAYEPGVPEDVGAEHAVIVWDGATHTEHFIRQADFVGKAKNFGFLVPTPEPPKLKAADDESFWRLEEMGAPKQVTHVIYKYRWTTLSEMMRPRLLTSGVTVLEAGSKSTQSVDILSSQHVGLYDATVLRANNARALEGWLHKHGFAKRAALQQWLAPYVRRGWAVTAFKLTAPRTVEPAQLTSVRMSFHTDRPFYPYSEPADQGNPSLHAKPRSLSVDLISDARMAGTLEAGGAWGGHPVFAKALGEGLDPDLIQGMGLTPQDASHARWVTAFTDRSASRVGDGDLYFQPSKTQDMLEVPPDVTESVEYTDIPVDAIAITTVGILGGAWFAGRRKRRAKRAAPA